MKILSYVLALLGVLLASVLIGWFDAGRVLESALSVGWGGFALVCAWQIAIFVVLGIAWDVVALDAPPRSVRVFIWGRMVRDAASNLLPFAQLGGFVVGARAVTLHGVAWPTAAASTVVDVTAEFLAQLTFAAIGLAIVLVRAPGAEVTRPAEVGIAVAAVLAVLFVLVQRKGFKGVGGVFAKLGHRVAGRWATALQDGMATVRAQLAESYRQPGRLALGWALHLAGWLGNGIAGWIAYRLVDAPIDLVGATAVEGLLAAIAAVAFLVPANVGVQEAGYAGLGALFGVPVELSLSVSLIRRARDLVVGLPILLIWQFVELRRLRVAAAK
ncbi:MAG: flippase-like domain-containing protein [Proteobacteria bacterium]|nr:flippase-like domain-containing protein [Pseudomonadota bacterium]